MGWWISKLIEGFWFYISCSLHAKIKKKCWLNWEKSGQGEVTMVFMVLRVTRWEAWLRSRRMVVGEVERVAVGWERVCDSHSHWRKRRGRKGIRDFPTSKTQEGSKQKNIEGIAPKNPEIELHHGTPNTAENVAPGTTIYPPSLLDLSRPALRPHGRASRRSGDGLCTLSTTSLLLFLCTTTIFARTNP